MENCPLMNPLIDTGIYQTLLQATSQDTSILKPAEQKLGEWETQPGFYPSVCKIISSKNLEVSVRWFGAVCLKSGIEKYYRKHAPNGISDAEKVIIRQELVTCFDEPNDAVAEQLAVIVAKIARMDWPREWPDVIDILVYNIKSNESELKRYRSLLILSHVIKTLSSKRLMGDKKLFSELTVTMYPIMYEFWNFSVESFLSANLEQRKNVKYKCDLEMSLLTAKILLKLTVFGFNKPHTSSHVLNFMAVIFERIKTFLQFRLSLRELEEQYQKIIEKHVMKLVKVLVSMLDIHPLSYVDFVEITLQYSSYYCFTKEGHELLFDTLLLRWLNLMKAILQCPEYIRVKALPEGGLENELTKKVIERKQAFFTPSVVQDICYKLINEYFTLNEQDLALWDSDPEEYAAEEIGESWKNSLRPCVEGLFLALLNQCKEILIPVIVSIIENDKASPNPDDIAAILKKDAMYNVFGLSVFDLFDEINFDKWFSEILIPELHVKSPNYRILRRRIAWLIGRWTGVKLSTELRPLLYAELIKLLDPSEDIAVRLMVAKTIKDVVDDFEFRSKVFSDYVPQCFQLLYTLLEESKECETKMQVLNVLSFIIERVGWEIAPFFDSLVSYLPMLWQHSEGHNMLRCAIVSVLTQIVRGLEYQCATLEEFVIPVIEYSLDMKKEGHVYLLEDGLHLFFTFLENVKNSEDIFLIFHYLPALLEKSTEHLKIITKIMTALLYLSPDKFMQSQAQKAIQTFLEILPDLKCEGQMLIYDFFENCVKLRPYHSVELLQSFLCYVIAKTNRKDEEYLVVSCRLTIISRIILFSNEVFAQLVEKASSGVHTSVDNTFAQFLDLWLSKIAEVWPTEKRKLLGLAMVNLLTAGSNIVLTRFSVIMAAIVEILNDILESDEGSFTDSLLFNDELLNTTNPDAEEELKTEHERRVRMSEIMLNDPVYRVDLLLYFQTQLQALQKQVGDDNFQQLMGTLSEDTINQIKLCIKST